jgi:hypothetical protein
MLLPPLPSFYFCRFLLGLHGTALLDFDPLCQNSSNPFFTLFFFFLFLLVIGDVNPIDDLFGSLTIM